MLVRRDNLAKGNLLEDILPDMVLATTWNQTFFDETNLVAVNGFTEDEAIEFLKRKNELTAEEVEDYKELNTQVVYPWLCMGKQKLYEVLTEFLNILKKDEVEEVFDMVLILQFLSLEDIPYYFQFLPAKEGVEDQALNPESFIEAIQNSHLAI
ncbi:unnamed protein product [Mytilus edulis]|uniref:Uncharacterized protein n=1 Tax=Mytilus edulis TaxID=6550 RepID=A0A8S3TDV4_MYTED|nr:unnamed protein product [Mytilus edulis]